MIGWLGLHRRGSGFQGLGSMALSLGSRDEEWGSRV